MLAVQKFLQTHTLEDINNYYGISATHHNDGRVILNYSQIDSPKSNDIARDCRGLVLNSKDFSLVSRSFRRFFNASELVDDFDYNNCTYFSKEDGSLINLYWWNGKFHINTRGSFGDGLVNDSNLTWRDLFISACPNYHKLNPKYSYTFELCSPYNQVVRIYNEPKAFLLSAFDGENELPFNSNVISDAESLGITIVNTHDFSNKDESLKFLEDCSKNDPTFEGFVLRDINNNRVKVKTSSYIILHKKFSNSINKSDIVELMLDGEDDEFLAYFPKYKYFIEDVKIKIIEIENVYNSIKNTVEQKDFARLALKYNFSYILFELRKNRKFFDIIRGKTKSFVNIM